MTQTAIHILDVIRRAPSKDRDERVINESILAIKQAKIWATYLQKALEEDVSILGQFGKDPVKTCEEGFVENQSLAIGCLSR